jgi:serine/threonine protein kinase
MDELLEREAASAGAGTPGIQLGRKIGKYEILRHMASGGMAEIYLARATGIENFEKYVVLKRILPAIANDPEVIRMLLDEARVAATLHHSNIVQVFDIGQIDNEYFICMEYLNGKNVAALAAAMQRRGERLDDDNALSIIIGVCAGLQYAHDKVDDQGNPLGIVHRDVSPHNVVITQDGGVKLVDFGLAKVANRPSESSSGTLKGKLAYMSPEQCRARPCDRRSDVFSLSIMLWELTTGERLYTGSCDYDYLCAILETDARRPSSVIPDYPAALEAIVMKGLARDPDARWPTVEAMQLELEEYCRDRRLKVSPITLRRTIQEVFGEELRTSTTMGTVTPADMSLGLGSIYGGRHLTEPAISRPARSTSRRSRSSSMSS